MDPHSNVKMSEKKGYDAERTTSQPRRMSRIGSAVPGTLHGDEDDSVIDVGKQIELEADNAIKYRTCSWRKVCITQSRATCISLPVRRFLKRPVTDMF
jgi:hypothetical protein